MATPPTAVKPKPGRAGAFARFLLVFLFLVLVGAVAAAVVRGEWADNAEKNPTSPDEGPVTQLFQKPNGNVVVRSTIVIDSRPKAVWSVVSGYSKYGDFLNDFKEVKASPQKDGRVLVTGVFQSRVGLDWPFQSLIKQTEAPDKGEFSATWTERDMDQFKLNRGSWSVTPTDKSQKQTLLICTLQIELKECPNFVIRDLLLYKLPAVMKAMRDQALSRKHG